MSRYFLCFFKFKNRKSCQYLCFCLTSNELGAFYTPLETTHFPCLKTGEDDFQSKIDLCEIKKALTYQPTNYFCPFLTLKEACQLHLNFKQSFCIVGHVDIMFCQRRRKYENR